MKKKKTEKNYLDFIPEKNSELSWEKAEDGHVTIDVIHKGIFAKIAQVVFHKPKVSHIALDEFGNFIWPLIDGNTSVYQIAQKVEDFFGEKASPLYERVVKYFQILQGHGFIQMKE